MKATSLHIQNFRGIKCLDLDLDEITVLIGENNSGKTAVLDAMRICLKDIGPRRRAVFNALDFHLADGAAEPASADPILIEITFSERSKGEWDAKLVRRLNRVGVVQVDDDECSHVILRVTCEHNPTNPSFDAEWAFLNLDREALTTVGDRALAGFQQEVSYYYLHALRDARHHFGERGPFWRPFLKDTKLSMEKKAEIEETIRQVNDLVVSSHDSFGRVHESLRQVQDVIPLSTGDVVSIEAVPGRMFDMLTNARVNLGTVGGAKIPVGHHGEGTQSLAVLTLFAAFLKAWPRGAPIVALEEPEAHLHPSAIRALQGLICRFSGQKLISTHSGDLLAETEIHQIRRLARTRKGVRSYRISNDLLSSEETRKFNYHIRHTRGELLFARCWLLVEGETEAWIFPAAARALKVDLHREGIRIITHKHTDVGLLATIANALGIAWFCVGDGDDEENKTKRKLRNHLGSAAETERMAFPYKNIEVHLLESGYDHIYAELMPNQNRAKIERGAGDPGYWTEYARKFPKNSKTRAAAAVGMQMETRGAEGVPEKIRDVLDRVLSLVRGV